MITYTCVGSVRGSCEKKHRKLEAACACSAKDMQSCRSYSTNSYSDRKPVRSDGESLSEEEYEFMVNGPS